MSRSPSPHLTEFDRAVERVVRAIPPGQVSSYSQVAQRAGAPGAARRVATALRRLRGLPWWRVVQAAGTLAPEVAAEQARHLRREGVEVRGRRILIAVPDDGLPGAAATSAAGRLSGSAAARRTPASRRSR